MSNTKSAVSQTINIISRHSTVAEAVKAAGIDLSYNQDLAERDIRQLDKGFRGNKVTEAFVTDKGVYYIYQCDIKILNKYEPFISVLDNCNFAIVSIRPDNKIFINEASLPKNETTRKAIAKFGIIVH